MTSVLLVAHAPLATALRKAALHAYPDCAGKVGAVDIADHVSREDAAGLIATALQLLPGPEVLVMVDAFGATPGNAALDVADGLQVRVVTGVNVPMVWRALCYEKLALGDLVTKAVDGARQGIMQVGNARPQNPPNPPPSDDPDPNSDQ